MNTREIRIPYELFKRVYTKLNNHLRCTICVPKNRESRSNIYLLRVKRTAQIGIAGNDSFPDFILMLFLFLEVFLL